MGFGFSNSNISPIAVDFGADSLKLLQVKLGQHPQILAAASLTVPAHARKGINERMTFYLESLKSAYKQFGFKGKRLMLSLPAYQTLTQHLQVGTSDSEEQIFDQIKLHLRQRFNVDPTRMVIRFVKGPASSESSSGKQDVIAIAASRDAVLHYIEIGHRAKLDVVGMHAESLALMEGLAHLQMDEQEAVCFLDFGAATSKAIITRGKSLAMARQVHVGGDHLIRATAEHHQLDWTEARQLFCSEAGTSASTHDSASNGHAAVAATSTATAAPPAPAATSSNTCPAVDDLLETLSDEVRMTIRQYQQRWPDQPVQRVVFVGGGAKQTALCQNLARRLKIAAQLGDPLVNVKPSTQKPHPHIPDFSKPQPGWSVPWGLCHCEANM